MVFLIILFGHIYFEYWDENTIDLMSSVDIIYGDLSVSDQIIGYVKFESGRPWPPHMFLNFLALSDPEIYFRMYICLLFDTAFNKI